MGKHLKILGLSLLALVGVMAVSASAAQAKWLLLVNGQSVLLTTFNVDVDEGELLVPELALAIHCEGGTGTGHVQLSSDHKTMSGSVDGTFHGCDDLNFGEVCDVRGVGDPTGLISAGGSGVATMEGAKVLVNAESTEFANVEYIGGECPLTEIDGRVSGSVTIEVANPLTDAALHAVTVTDQELFFGENEAELHDGEEGAATGSIESLNGETLAVHLVGL